MKDVIATYYFRPRSDTNPDQAAQAICDEETTGTWTDISTRTEAEREREKEKKKEKEKAKAS